MEIDGLPLTGKLSATGLEANFSNDDIELKWNVINSEGKAKIWLATTKDFKPGAKDVYSLFTEVPVANGSVKIDAGQTQSDFYKIVIEMPYNFLNRWVTAKK